MAKYRILSIDGGGLRGLIAVRLLEQLAEDPDLSGWLDQVDLIAGTSTGGIIALGLAAGLSLDEMGSLYQDKGAKIFDDSVWDNVKDVGKTIGADYSNRSLKRELKRVFGDSTLGSFKKKVAITAFDLDNQDDTERKWKPKIFHNYSGAGTDKLHLARNVAAYTSAAPTYFPAVDGFVDGGVFANNPSMVALSQAISRHNRSNERAELDDVVLLSVGTGFTPKYIKGQSLDWGFAQWAKPILEILTDGVMGIADYQCAQLLGERYERMQVSLAEHGNIAMDDVANIGLMNDIGRGADVRATKRWIEQQWL